MIDYAERARRLTSVLAQDGLRESETLAMFMENLLQATAIDALKDAEKAVSMMTGLDFDYRQRALVAIRRVASSHQRNERLPWEAREFAEKAAASPAINAALSEPA